MTTDFKTVAKKITAASGLKRKRYITMNILKGGPRSSFRPIQLAALVVIAALVLCAVAVTDMRWQPLALLMMIAGIAASLFALKRRSQLDYRISFTHKELIASLLMALMASVPVIIFVSASESDKRIEETREVVYSVGDAAKQCFIGMLSQNTKPSRFELAGMFNCALVND